MLSFKSGGEIYLFWNGDQVQVVFSQDCHDREVITWIATSKGIDRLMIQDLMAESVDKRFGKVLRVPHSFQWLSDNGSPYVARDTVAFQVIGADPVYNSAS